MGKIIMDMIVTEVLFIIEKKEKEYQTQKRKAAQFSKTWNKYVSNLWNNDLLEHYALLKIIVKPKI